jgi:hypothetical protein
MHVDPGDSVPSAAYAGFLQEESVVAVLGLSDLGSLIVPVSFSHNISCNVCLAANSHAGGVRSSSIVRHVSYFRQHFRVVALQDGDFDGTCKRAQLIPSDHALLLRVLLRPFRGLLAFLLHLLWCVR